MPNGFSCIGFGVKNAWCGHKEDNNFKKGIALIQSVRALDAAKDTKYVKKVIHNAEGLSKLAGILKLSLYPLIAVSGVYNTIKSDDKVKTGVNQATSITAMIFGDQIAEKKLVPYLMNKLSKIKNIAAHNKLMYVISGSLFMAFSMLSYSLGDKISNAAVDFVRRIKSKPQSEKPDADKNEYINEKNIFAEMPLTTEE